MAEFTSPCLQEALRLADMGLYVFPARVEAGKKASYLSAEHAPGGLNWGMSNDPEQVRKNFSNTRWRLKCGVGIPTGWINKVFVIETDTVKGHNVDGAKALRALEKKYGKLPKTKMAKSPSGSVHRYYRHPGEHIRLKSMSIAPGVDVKADGGMVIAPPTVRGDGKYVWMDTRDVAEAPAWLIDLIKDESPNIKGNGHDVDDPWVEGVYAPLSEAKIIEGCEIIAASFPNEDDDWDEWNWVGMKIYATAPNDDGYAAFDGYSERSNKYDARTTAKKWGAYRQSPPTQFTQGSFIDLVKQADPNWHQDAPIDDDEEIDDRPAEEFIIKPKANGTTAPMSDVGPPVDLWGTFNAPELPRGLLPSIIEKYAFAHAEQMGSDPAGFAMGALVACATVIPDRIKIQPKDQDPTFTQSARLWVALVGRSSTLKSPIFRVVMRVIARIDDELAAASTKKIEEWNQLEPKEKKTTPKPPFQRIAMEDVTIEAAQEIAADNQDGLIMSRDELSGFFASMEQYSSKKGGASSARPFWLGAYEGERYTLDRIGRGHQRARLSVNVFGGIQPDVIRGFSWGHHDDGLIERLLCIMLRKSGLDKNVPLPAEAKQFDALVKRLYQLRKQHNTDELVMLDADAERVREEFVREYRELSDIFETSNRMLASHIGKYHGLFARLCLLWHIIEHHEDAWQTNIDGDTAQRVARFMREFLWPHAVAFHFGVLNVGHEHDKLVSVAGWILAHTKHEVANRDLQASLQTFRGLTQREITPVFEQLHSLGWLERKKPERNTRPTDPPRWTVVPAVHDLFKARAKQEAEQRAIIRAKLIEKKVYHNLNRFKVPDEENPISNDSNAP